MIGPNPSPAVCCVVAGFDVAVPSNSCVAGFVCACAMSDDAKTAADVASNSLRVGRCCGWLSSSALIPFSSSIARLFWRICDETSKYPLPSVLLLPHHLALLAVSNSAVARCLADERAGGRGERPSARARHRSEGRAEDLQGAS